jgi:hypothetical protein
MFETLTQKPKHLIFKYIPFYMEQKHEIKASHNDFLQDFNFLKFCCIFSPPTLISSVQCVGKGEKRKLMAHICHSWHTLLVLDGNDDEAVI